MKEITRIHIAKTAYDIELSAKKELERYLHALETYSNDPGVVEDIEVRITELFAERGIANNGVITHTDVEAIKAQLGDPEEFAEEGDIALGAAYDDSGKKPLRRLYRNLDNALLGGVLSGIATFFKASPIWTRLIFILVVFISFGTALLVYVIMWIVVPPARTAAEKLQLRGIAPTASSIRELNIEEAGLDLEKREVRRKRLFANIVGTLALVAALFSAGVTIALTVAMTIFGSHSVFNLTGNEGLVLGIAGISFLVLVTLFFSIASYAGYTSKFNKRIVISLVSLVLAGIIIVGSAATYAANKSWQFNQHLQSLIKEQSIDTKNQLSNATKLVVNAPDVYVNYVKSDSQKISYSGLPGPVPIISKEGSVVTIKYSPKTKLNDHFVQTQLTIYGPVIPEIDARVSTLDLSIATDSLTLTALNSVRIDGSIENLTATIKRSGTFDARDATIGTAKISLEAGGEANFGTIRSLSATLPDTCPASQKTGPSVITLAGIVDGTMTINGNTQKAAAYKSACASIYFDESGTPPRDRSYEPYP